MRTLNQIGETNVGPLINMHKVKDFPWWEDVLKNVESLKTPTNKQSAPCPECNFEGNYNGQTACGYCGYQL